MKTYCMQWNKDTVAKVIHIIATVLSFRDF